MNALERQGVLKRTVMGDVMGDPLVLKHIIFRGRGAPPPRDEWVFAQVDLRGGTALGPCR